MNSFRTSIPGKRVLVSVKSLEQCDTKLIEVVLKLSKEMNYNTEYILDKIKKRDTWEEKVEILRDYFRYLLTD